MNVVSMQDMKLQKDFVKEVNDIIDSISNIRSNSLDLGIKELQVACEDTLETAKDLIKRVKKFAYHARNDQEAHKKLIDSLNYKDTYVAELIQTYSDYMVRLKYNLAVASISDDLMKKKYSIESIRMTIKMNTPDIYKRIVEETEIELEESKK